MSDLQSIGLGTYKQSDREECIESVRTALDVGYHYVDTVQLYENEHYVGEGLAAADVDSEEVFGATKLWRDQLAPETVREAARESRDRLSRETIDLLYVHWPAGEYDPKETLRAFDELRKEGVIEHVGVSNFTPDLLTKLVRRQKAQSSRTRSRCIPSSSKRNSGSTPSTRTYRSSRTRHWPAGRSPTSRRWSRSGRNTVSAQHK